MGTAIIGLNNSRLKVSVVEQLPETGTSNKIYFVPVENPTGTNKYDEYIWVKDSLNPSGRWELIGSTDIDLSEYYNKEEVDLLLLTKVTVVAGKGLSTNDYTTAEKTKLASLENTPIATKDVAGKVKVGSGLLIETDGTLSTVDIPAIDLLSYGIEWDINDGTTVTRIGNLDYHRELPIQSALRGCVSLGKDIKYYFDPNDWTFKADGTPSRRDGYDGLVTIEVPNFFLWSEIEGDKRRVRISLLKLVPYAVEIPHMLVGAYRSTILTEVPEDMGYLSTLPVNSAVSIANTESYCRGGGNRTAYDTYLGTDASRTDLGKPRTNINRMTFRTYARNTGSESMCYDYYKAIFYWLYVIEYANFNSLANFNSTLTADGYKQGGLGSGITTINSSIWSAYNAFYPLTPCGYGDDLGNNTDIKPLIIPETLLTYLSVWFNSWTANSATCTSANSSYNSKKITEVKSVSDYAFSASPTLTWGTMTYRISGLTDGLTVIFKERLTGTNYSTAVVLLEVTEDGDVTINWSNYNTGSTKYVGFSSVQSDCSIMIYNTDQSTYEFTQSQQTFNMPRWRGFDNPFGDIWTNLEGIIIQGDTAGNPKTVYTTTNPDNFGDSDVYKEKMRIAGHEIHQDGYIKTFDLGETAEIIPSSVGGSTTTYKCDLHWAGAKDTTLRRLRVGGTALYGSSAGLAAFHSYDGVAHANSAVGFRLVIVL